MLISKTFPLYFHNSQKYGVNEISAKFLAFSKANENASLFIFVPYLVKTVSIDKKPISATKVNYNTKQELLKLHKSLSELNSSLTVIAKNTNEKELPQNIKRLQLSLETSNSFLTELSVADQSTFDLIVAAIENLNNVLNSTKKFALATYK